MKTFLMAVLIFNGSYLGLLVVLEAIRVWRERRAAKAVVLQAETVVYLAALARLQHEEDHR